LEVYYHVDGLKDFVGAKRFTSLYQKNVLGEKKETIICFVFK